MEGAPSFGQSEQFRTWRLGTFDIGFDFGATRLTAMSLLRPLSRRRQYICQQCVRQYSTPARGERPKTKWAEGDPDPATRQLEWEEQAGKIRYGMQHSMLSLLEERGFVKDVAGSVYANVQA